MDLLAFTLAMLQIGEETDRSDMLFWRTRGEFAPVTFFVMCSAFFSWASADAEPVTGDDIPELRKAIADVYAVEKDEREWGFLLWVCRKRGKQPADFAYRSMPANTALILLFKGVNADGVSTQS
jgi:hypothetical protein